MAWALEAALAAGLDATAVVAGATDLAAAGVVPAGVDVIANTRWAEGQATSLQAARAWAEAADHQALVVGLGDQPLVEAAAWRAIADAAGRVPADESAPPARIWVATYDGARRNPVGLHRDIWPLLPTTGDEGARVVMRLRPEFVQEIPCAGEAADIDTPEDLERWS